MKRLHLRYLSVALTLCVMLIGAAIAAASPSDRGTAPPPDRPQAQAEGRLPSLSVSSATAVSSVRPVLVPSAHSAATPQLAADYEQRYQWTGIVRYVNGNLVVERRCDRWLLDPQSDELHEALRAAVDDGAVDIWGYLSKHARQTISVHAVYRPGDARPRIYVPDYPCPREREPEVSVEWASGYVGEVHLEDGVVVLRLRDGAMRFIVTDDTGIAIDGQRARLSDLEPGMPARIAYEKGTQKALRIMAASERPQPQPEIETVGGVIGEVHVEEGVVVLRLRDSAMRFIVTDDTGIAVDGQRARLSDLEPGMAARIAYEKGTQKALRIMAATQQSQPRPEVEWTGGHVSVVDVEGMAIALRLQDGSEVKFRVTADTHIVLDGERVRLSALQVRMPARIAYESGTHVALRIMAVSERPQPGPGPDIQWASGHIGEVHLEDRIVVLRLPDGPMRFVVTDDTGIAIDGERTRLSDLEPGMPARIAYEKGTQKALRIMAVSS